MPISVTNIGTNSGKLVANNGTVAVTVPVGGVPTGALIVFAFAMAPGSRSVADTASNTYTGSSGTTFTNINTSLIGGTGYYYAWNCTALVSGNTITLTNQTGGTA